MNSKAKISGASRDCSVKKGELFSEREREHFFLDRIKLLLFLVSNCVIFSESSMVSGHSGKRFIDLAWCATL